MENSKQDKLRNSNVLINVIKFVSKDGLKQLRSHRLEGKDIILCSISGKFHSLPARSKF